MDLTFESLDGTQTHNASDYNLKVIDFIVSTPKMRAKHDYLDGRDGFIEYGTDFGERFIKISFLLTSFDRLDTVLLRNEIFRFIVTKQSFYIIDSRETTRRWVAKLANEFDFKQDNQTVGRFDVILMAQPYAESIGTTLDPFTFDSELWGVGLELPADTELEYTHTTNTFDIYNVSDKKIDPRVDPLEITLTNDDTVAITGLTITNNTNGTEWSYTGTIDVGQTVKLNGVRSLKNDVSIFPETNRGLIALEKGVNNFTITGATAHTTTFNFRFYYL